MPRKGEWEYRGRDSAVQKRRRPHGTSFGVRLRHPAPYAATPGRRLPRAGGKLGSSAGDGARPEMYEAYYRFLYPLHTEGVVEAALKELVRLKIADLNQCLF